MGETVRRLAALSFVWTAVALSGVASATVRAQEPGTESTSIPSPTNGGAMSPAGSPGVSAPLAAEANPGRVDDLLRLDLDQLSNVRVRGAAPHTNLAVPSSVLSSDAIQSSDASTTGALLDQLPTISTRRTSAINMDPRVRGYHSAQLKASANGMTQLKTRPDIDSLFSQIDPGVVQDITVIEGPYTSLYGPGFAFLDATLLQAPRYEDGPESHLSTTFAYGSNGHTLYNRDTVVGGGRDWGMCLSYGLRKGSDYHPGGASYDSLVPASYGKWDGLFAFSFDLSPVARVEFNYLRTEMNRVELPGVAYDLDNSKNDQFNIRYVLQEDREGPEQFVLQHWYNQTTYRGDSTSDSKQQSLYYSFFSLPAFDEFPVNTPGRGRLNSLGVRVLRTFGDAESIQWTIGTDWRRYGQRYLELDLDASGQEIFFGNEFGIPKSRMDDVGFLTDVKLPISERLSVNVGGRVDECKASFNPYDPVVTQFAVPQEYYYLPGFEEPSHTLGMAYATGKLKLTEQHALQLGVGYGMRMPDLAELYSDDPYVPVARFGNSYLSGNSTLRPERNLQVDAGITSQTKTVKYGVRGFYSTIRDYITPVPACIDPTPPDFIAAPKVMGRDFQYFPPQWRTDLGTSNENADTNQAGYIYANVDCAVLFGGDLFGEAQLSDWLSVFGNMSYVRGVNCNPVVYVDDGSWLVTQGQFVPIGHSEGLMGIYPYSGTAGVRMSEPETDLWGLELSARMVRRQDYVAVSLSELPTAGFTTFALQAYYRLRPQIRLTLNVDNLFNRDYTEHGSLVIIGRDGNPTFVKEPGTTAVIGMDARF